MQINSILQTHLSIIPLATSLPAVFCNPAVMDMLIPDIWEAMKACSRFSGCSGTSASWNEGSSGLNPQEGLDSGCKEARGRACRSVPVVVVEAMGCDKSSVVSHGSQSTERGTESGVVLA